VPGPQDSKPLVSGWAHVLEPLRLQPSSPLTAGTVPIWESAVNGLRRDRMLWEQVGGRHPVRQRRRAWRHDRWPQGHHAHGRGPLPGGTRCFPL